RDPGAPIRGGRGTPHFPPASLSPSAPFLRLPQLNSGFGWTRSLRRPRRCGEDTGPDMTPKIARFLAERNPPTPCLVVDLDVTAHTSKRLKPPLPLAEIYYAVKANPAPEVLRLLEQLGSKFDTASIYEIEDALALGISAAKLSFGNTIKKEGDIARA